MPVPWMQIVQLMPSILEVSRELLKRTRRAPPPPPPAPASGGSESAGLEARIAALEENERRQAELVTNMAEQLGQLTTAVTALHRQARRLIIGQTTAVIVAVIAVLIALR
jgi:uncharacterized coiled-coil protein SlyX